jgi:hypothetical protein
MAMARIRSGNMLRRVVPLIVMVATLVASVPGDLWLAARVLAVYLVCASLAGDVGDVDLLAPNTELNARYAVVVVVSFSGFRRVTARSTRRLGRRPRLRWRLSDSQRRSADDA